MLVDSGIPYVIIQPTVFMQMLTPAIQSVKNGGPFVQKFYTSVQTKMSYIDMKDYADAAAEIIVAGTYTYGTYEFCSEGTYSLADMESIFSELTGRKVEGAFISDADFLATTHKTPDSYAGQTLLTMFRHYNENSFCGNAFTLTQILGRHPVTILEYLQKAFVFSESCKRAESPTGKNCICGRTEGRYHAGTDPDGLIVEISEA